MARGFKKFEDAAQEASERNSTGGYAKLRLKLEDGQEAIVRFLEEGDSVAGAWFHKVTVEGRTFPVRVICLDQDDETGARNGTDCPGCDQSLPRSFRGYFNVIWRDAPVFKRNDEGKVVKDSQNKLQIVGNETQVALWETDEETAFALADVDESFKGLTSRDFKIKRRGEKLATTYTVQPADADGGPQPMSEEDIALAKAEANDLDALLAKPDYNKWGKGSGGGGSKPEVTPSDTSPFKRRSAETADAAA
jgi:hypothetical protein